VIASAVLAGATLVVAPAAQDRLDAFVASRDHPAIRYSEDRGSDRVAALEARLQRGDLTLAFDAENGYLGAMLAALGVPSQSQSLVFSETSAQASHVSLTNPRAIFFGDDVAVGWVRGADVLELAAHDPQQGVIFYTLPQHETTAPRLTRDDSCLLCHQSWETRGVPGMLVLSTFPMADDPHAYASGVFMNHTTPYAQRWSGWYVTRARGMVPHRGNLPIVLPADELQSRRPRVQLKSVTGRFDLTGYPNACSDIVALSVLAHQAQATNLITRLGWEWRVAESESAYQLSSGPQVTPRVSVAVDELADYLMFADEARLPGPLEGGCGFAEQFAAQGPRDANGRSLRDFDLERRIFRYPVSYMVYTPAFDGLPRGAKSLVYARILATLSRARQSLVSAGYTDAERRAALEIVRSTKRDLPTAP
jgi:hypothetical protein